MTVDAAKSRSEPAYDRDIVIVGGGPAGCSAAVFTARHGLDTVVFDRGNASLRRCAYLENYLGFPAGVDVETFYDLAHDHAERAGAEVIADLVVSVARDGRGGFRVETQDGRELTTRRVVAAAKYDGEYPDRDGRTPVDGLYVAGPLGAAEDQAIIAAGHGAVVGRSAIADARVDDGWWGDAADQVDWVRRAAELDDEWAARETWVEWFDDRFADGAPVDPGDPRFERVREEYIDASLSTYVEPDEIDARAESGHEALAEHVDVEAVVSAVDESSLLDAIDDDAIREYVNSGRVERETG
ncbi:NAD(P)/FAD-dependent oxidoreductase [Halegenticoccus soli]|uniref:NAD(P)/FAD-dependent oxidoreductase n=1 Tax=Halegenticoccus soli TaxID=1985678 RepID=UPI000C6CB884|nr:NAD(P)/FAD-dependent oxidoreductase [Halegenticoccus soli]